LEKLVAERTKEHKKVVIGDDDVGRNSKNCPSSAGDNSNMYDRMKAEPRLLLKRSAIWEEKKPKFTLISFLLL